VDEERIPVLVGAAQFSLHDVDPRRAPTPFEMLERLARELAEDSGAGEGALADVDVVGLVSGFGVRSFNPARALAERIGAKPRREVVTAVGGEVPLSFVDHLAREIEAGRVRSALVVGSHALKTLSRARKAGIELDWSVPSEGQSESFLETLPGNSDLETAHGLDRPSSCYPLFENALRARRGLDLETHRRRVGALMSGFTAVAAANPNAWYPIRRTADEITLPSPDNRMVAFPYTKYMNAVMQTDQAAGVWIMSRAAALAYGVPEERQVRYWGGESAVEKAWYLSERPDFARCPALQIAVEGGLARAGIGQGEVDRIDFYSCFPVAVEMACEMLGLDEADARGFTVTGGLPYAGGPGNNYTMHSLATMVASLREKPGNVGLVTGNGWYLTKHSSCVLSTEPRAGGPRAASAVDVPDPVVIAAQPSGRGTVEAYTVLYDREGAPVRGLALGRLENGERFVANTPDDRDLLEAFAASEQVGRQGVLRPGDVQHRFDPA
jgi:acetyl-CoA C-acetyltransferase